MNHFLSIEELSTPLICELIENAAALKAERSQGEHNQKPLTNQIWALIFSKASTRTRVSFEVGIRELGGSVMFLSSNDIQLGRGEPIKDTARVLGRMVHGAIIRTYDQQDVVDFAKYSSLPTVNALTDEAHPCQILSDLFTIRELLGSWEGKKIAFVGDGFNNMARSWMWAAKKLGFTLAIAAPQGHQATPEYLTDLDAAHVSITTDPAEAVRNADVINTDVWLSMGQEDQSEKEKLFSGYQVNSALLENAHPEHIVLHCLPAYRGKEITEEVLEKNAGAIFQQAENRLHIQKAILHKLASQRA